MVTTASAPRHDDTLRSKPLSLRLILAHPDDDKGVQPFRGFRIRRHCATGIIMCRAANHENCPEFAELKCKHCEHSFATKRTSLVSDRDNSCSDCRVDVTMANLAKSGDQQ